MLKWLKALGKKWIIVGASAAVVTVGVIIAVVMMNKAPESYRTIAVEELNGTTVIQSGKKSKEAYEGMHLKSGDDVTVQSESNMTMLVDMDKYLFAQEGTHFWLEASGKEGSGKTTIYVDKGSALSRIVNPLEEGEVFEISTPNSTMSVRGTVFRIEIVEDENGQVYSTVDVFDGAVEVTLNTLDGDTNGVTGTIEAGKSATVRADETLSEFVVGENGEIVQEIDYESLPLEIAEELLDYSADGEELCITDELLKDYVEITGCVEEQRIIEEADCTKEGKAEYWCTVCDRFIREEVIAKKEHTEATEWQSITAVTCLENGREGLYCSVCGELLEEREIEATGHELGEWEIETEGSCTKDTVNARKCVNCDYKETETIEAEGHEMTEWAETLAATCTAEGEESRECSVCGKTETNALSMLEHELGDWTTQTATTCTVAGLQVKKCINCDYVEEQTIAALGHVMGGWQVAAEPTCTELGSNVRTCSHGCGHSESQTVAATGHTIEEIIHNEFMPVDNDGNYESETIIYCAVCAPMDSSDGIGETHSVQFVVEDDTTGDGYYYCNTCGINVERPAT